MNIPRFTFCIPNLNKIKYLPTCIESVLAQDCQDWRCVFVDGYSTDGSWEYMQKFASDPRFLIRRGIKQGMYADWNECLKYVETDYFYILTSDDTCYPELVSTTVNTLDLHPDVDACHFRFAFIDEIGKITAAPEEITRQHCDLYCDVNQFAHRRSGICEFMMHFVYRAIYTTITSLVFRRNLIDRLKGFKTTCGVIADYDWTMRLGLFTDVLYIPQLLATWRTYTEQATKTSDGLDNQDKLLSVAKENLIYFMATEASRQLQQSIKYHHVLSDFHDQHASALYKKILSSTTITDAKKYLILSTERYPFYPLKKSLNRLSLNTLYDYPSRIKLAEKFIYEYGLQWPPQIIHPVDLSCVI